MLIDNNYIKEIIETNPLRLIFSNKTQSSYEFDKVKINLKKIKDDEIYQVEKFTKKQVFHENIGLDELEEQINYYMENFRQLASVSETYNVDMRVSKKGKVFFSKHEQKNEIKPIQSHNKKKNYILNEGTVIEPLVDLGVFTKDGKVVNSKYDKFKQINRFVEIIDHEVKNIEQEYIGENAKTLNVLDFGCGKSYLTFILYYYLTEIKKMNVNIIGLDLKEDVIDNCNATAKKYGYKNLKFELGDINGYKYENNVDMVITLHACDTATDYALFNAINWKARMIFSVPCCQHEINASISPNNLSLVSKYGLIQERVSALFTDAIRANILETQGYKTQLLEFIDMSHSPKNILIRAVRSNISEAKKEKALGEIESMRNEFNFKQTLYDLCKSKGMIK